MVINPVFKSVVEIQRMTRDKFSAVLITLAVVVLAVNSSPFPEGSSDLPDSSEYYNLPDDKINSPWQGKWFPVSPGQEVDDNPIANLAELKDDKHGIKMGVSNSHCDDAKTRLEVDWLDDSTNYTCYSSKHAYLPRMDVHPIYKRDFVPKEYSAQHKCMDTAITYDTYLPTFGTHRPLWPKYGEYLFVPRQRWIHNLEHGAIVMLYHPCANNIEVEYLKSLVVNCIYRHVITPYNLLTPERPLALVAWGRKLEMSKVNPRIVTEFIKIAAKKGPEHTSKDGQYDYGLLKHAEEVSDVRDDVLCPSAVDIETK